MLKIRYLVLLLVAIAGPYSQAEEEQGTLKQDTGYFFGYSIGNMLKRDGNQDIDLDAFLAGVKDSFKGVDPALTPEQQNAVIAHIQEKQKVAQQAAAERQQAVAQTLLEGSRAFLAENASKEGVVTTDSGLQYLVLTEGNGAQPGANSRVKVHYEGRLADGTVFDSSYQRGQPAEFGLNQVISGWTEGLQLMKTGGKSRLFIPPELGYGPGGTGSIPPNAALVFDVELIEIIQE